MFELLKTIRKGEKMKQQYVCEKCYAVLDKEELQKHVEKYKHHTFRIRGLNMIISIG